MKLARRISRDDTAVKLLFDHVRNLGIAAVALGAATWKYRTAAVGWVFYAEILIVALLAFLACFYSSSTRFMASANFVKLAYRSGCFAWPRSRIP